MGGGRVGARRRRGRPAAIQETLFEIDTRPGVRYYRQILDALGRSDFGRDASDVARVVSRLFGSVWAAQDPPRDGSTEESFGLGLVEQARQRRAPASVTLLRALAVVAPIREVREAAESKADALVAAGLPDPPWAPQLRAEPTGRCWVYEDVFGDMATVICEYVREPGGTHAILVQVDHAAFSTATGISLTDEVEAVVRDLQNTAKTNEPMFALRLVDATWARAMLERAFARTDLIEGVVVEPGFAEVRAIALEHVRSLPDASHVVLPEPGPPTPQHCRGVAADFLSDVEGQEIADREGAEAVATLYVEYATTYDPADLARVSPAKWDIFLSDWLPRRGLPDPTHRAALPAVVRAWSAWAARRAHMAEPVREELVRAVEEMLGGS